MAFSLAARRGSEAGSGSEAPADRGRGRAALGVRGVSAALLLLGLYHVGLGLLMALSPGTFFDVIASYGTRNDHYIRDVSTFYLAMGVVQLVAVARLSWRLPVLAFTALQYALHVVNHARDVGEADPGWIGPVNLVSLMAVTVVILATLRSARRARR